MRMDVDKLLEALFDYQRLERAPALQSVLDEVEARYFGEELSDDVMTTLAAAGDPYSARPPHPLKGDGPL